MLSSNSIKIILALISSLASACGFWQSKTEATPTPFVAEEIKSDVPFSTKEPNEYQTEIVVTATGGVEDVTFVAKSGANRLTVFDYQKNSEYAVLNLGDGTTVLLNRNRKLYSESESATNNLNAKGESPTGFLTAELLNVRRDAKFERLGAENNLTKYLVRLDDAPNSEIVISVDEKIGLPIKQEFYTVVGEQKNLTMTVELKNFKAQTEAKFFEVPKDHRKVTLKEFRESLRGEQK